MKPAVVRKQSAASRKAAHRAATEKVNAWYASHGWEPFPFQRRTWQAYLDGQSGLIHAVTGTGKTQAAWFGPVIEAIAEQAVSNGITGTQPLPLIDEPQLSEAPVLKKGRGGKQKRLQEPPLRVLWITPLRALAADTARALAEPLTDCGLMWTVETRTGDTIAATKRQQQTQLPTALVTTPESLSLLLTRNDTQHQMRDLRMVVVDEWHELLGTKRGVQTELALARLRRWFPSLRVWGLSATLGNTDFAGQVLMGAQSDPAKTTVISGGHRKQTIIRTLIPNEIERLPWAGHLGLKLLPEVIEGIDQAGSSLVFTNTRYQAEQWYQSILQSKPEWAGQIALHHGSLDPSVRKWVEQALRDQKLKCVVCTSSLDLGVDFTPVQRVFQVGSPKGIARMLQRAGRSGHQPGATSEIVAVPTNAFELVEVAAARDAMQARQIESRVALVAPLDVLVQHAVTISIGTGFQRDELLSEVRTSHAYQSLTEMDWGWVLDFITVGGNALRAYDDYHRVRCEEGVYRIASKKAAWQHRLNIGTITSDASLQVQFLKGGKLGFIEESFASRLAPGDNFTFAGRSLELVAIRDMKVYVRKSKAKDGPIPRWMGGRMPLSTELAEAVRAKLQEANEGQWHGVELKAVRPVLELQSERSRIPDRDDLLIEQWKSREGHHLYLFPFAGRLVHEGLAALIAYRLSRRSPISFALTVNDYGMELLSNVEVEVERAAEQGLFSPDGLVEDVLSALNSVEMSRRHFREIARVAGLVTQGSPAQRKSTKQLQASAGLLFDVFTTYDADNRLLHQAKREVLERELEIERLQMTLQRMQSSKWQFVTTTRPTPLAFPLLVDRLRERLSSENLLERIRKMQIQS